MHEILISIAEDQKALRISAELPGVSTSNVEVCVEGNSVDISGEKKTM